MKPSTSVRLTIMVDNLARSGLVVEHGFSAWVEAGGQRILFGVSRVHAVVGGFHLLEATPQRVERTLHDLGEISPDLIVPVHCTGEGAVVSLRQAFGDRVQPGRAGMVLELPG